MSEHDSYRPVYHFTPPANFMNDPNGMVFYRGEYHLFYQHNPFGATWGHMCWGHAISPDMLHWQHLPLALREEDGVMIFSGSAVVDWQNTSGFGQGADPPLIAIYTGHTATEQAQYLAYSLDAGRTWTKHAGHPVIAIGARDFRDPKVFWHAATGRWIMVTALADQCRVRFYGSPDLIHWEHLSDFGPAGSTGIWECPDLFPLPVEGERETMRWMLKTDVGPRNLPKGLCAQYFVGQFDGVQFANDNPSDLTLWSDCGKDFYAAQSWADVPAADGRRLWLAWMSNWQDANITPTSPWRGAMTIPRALVLRRFPEGLRLVQRPVTELTSLRRSHFGRAGLPVDEANAQLRASNTAGAALEIIADFRLADATQVGLRVRAGRDEATVVGYDALTQHIFVDRSQSGDSSFSPNFGDRHTAPLPHDDGRVRLHLFVDRCSVEVFGGGGRTVISDLIFPTPDSAGLEVYAVGGKAVAERLDVWQLQL